MKPRIPWDTRETRSEKKNPSLASADKILGAARDAGRGSRADYECPPFPSSRVTTPSAVSRRHSSRRPRRRPRSFNSQIFQACFSKYATAAQRVSTTRVQRITRNLQRLNLFLLLLLLSVVCGPLILYFRDDGDVGGVPLEKKRGSRIPPR